MVQVVTSEIMGSAGLSSERVRQRAKMMPEKRRRDHAARAPSRDAQAPRGHGAPSGAGAPPEARGLPPASSSGASRGAAR